MNTALVSGLTILAASTSLFLPALSAAEEACKVQAIQNETTFPERSQLRGQEGVVYLNVVVGEDGHVQSTALERSSGFRLLDNAASSSVEHWVFDVSNCARKDLPAKHVVAVDFRNDAY